MKNQGGYEDIIHLPHHVSTRRPHMDRKDRAAQFSPFAALTGYEACIQEAARLTDEKMDLDEEIRRELDRKLRFLVSRLSSRPKVQITYFQKDEKKEGGSYQTEEGRLKKVDDYEKAVCMEGGKKIPIENIVEIQWENISGEEEKEWE